MRAPRVGVTPSVGRRVGVSGAPRVGDEKTGESVIDVRASGVRAKFIVSQRRSAMKQGEQMSGDKRHLASGSFMMFGERSRGQHKRSASVTLKGCFGDYNFILV